MYHEHYNSPDWIRRIVLVALSTACVFVCAPVAAQSQPDAGAPAADPTDLGSTGAEDEATATPSADDDAAGDQDDRSESLQKLVDVHGFDEDAIDSPQEITLLVDGLEADIERLIEQRRASVDRLNYLEAGATILDEQRQDASLPEQVRTRMAGSLAVNRAGAGVRLAIEQSLKVRVDTVREQLVLLERHREQLLEAKPTLSAQVEDTQDRLDQAEAAEKSAMEQAALARQREAEEVDDQVRRLIKERREVLEELADLARSKGRDIQEVTEAQSARIEEFTSRRESLEATISGYPADPSASFARDSVDPVFSDVMGDRREVRRSYIELVDQYDRSLDELDAAEDELAQRRAELEEARQRVEKLGETDIGNQQVGLAEARVELAELQRDVARDRADALRKRVDLNREQIDFYNQSIERLLPLISNEQRDQFYSILSNENWESAWFSIQEVSRRVLDLLERRGNQALDLTQNWGRSLDRIWDFTFNLGWRLLLIGFVFFIGFDYISEAMGRLTSYVLKRRFFKRRPTLTIKVAELIRAALRPVILYALLFLVVDFSIANFPELVFLRWAVDAFFLFWIAMTVVKVLVLPRRYRETVMRSPAPEISEFELSGLVGTGDQADLLTMELNRARKLVRSIQIVLLFWLLQHYVPMAVTELLGHSVITWLVGQAFLWGLAIVVYLVLTTWKNDIARLFSKLAADRMPRAVEFVQTNKDEFYGVFVIAGAFLYVLAREIAMLTKRYASDTEWSKRVSNFVFRKRIELQQREREGDEPVIPADESALPPEYLDYFEIEPVHDESYAIHRSDIIDDIIGDIRAWMNRKGQGSTAIPGESGIGKTTVLIQLIDEVAHEFDDLLITSATVTEKFDTSETVLGFIAQLFGLEAAPKSRAELVEMLNAQASRIVILDDCHHLYMREIGGFAALDTFLEVVNLTDDRHYWVLAFNRFAWSYINRVRQREHFFGHIEMLEPWTDRDIQDLIQRRNAEAEMQVSFTDLIVAHEEGENDFYEIIKTANGYFRLLHEFSRGNPAIALIYWERSVKLEPDGTLQVTLFRRPSVRIISQLSDDHLFALTAIAQHGALNPREIAEVINSEVGFCDMALNFFDELNIIDIDPRTGRASITPLYFRQIVSRLSGSNFLWE
ncbi:MAG: AAA family ATPase [Myxococcota bacterium]